MNLAIEGLLKKNPELKKKRRGLPGTGSRPDQLPFFSDLKKIDDAFVYSNSLYALEDTIDKSLKLFNAGAGSPLRTQPFPLASENLNKINSCEELSQYQLAAGNEEYRSIIANYLLKQGFLYENNNVGPNNIIFNDSTTESFNLLVEVLSRPYDVFLFTGPTYGLFCYIPERHNAVTRIVPLSEEDDWKINPEKLEENILHIQSELAELQVQLQLDYRPKIVAFVNINPSNPTGIVMGANDLDRLSALKYLSQKYGFFIIDDIIYRDLSFPGHISAVPLATIDDENENIITLMGASKSYGLAGARAGMIIADERIIRGVRNQVFQLMDSTPLYIGTILSSIFNTSFEREKCYEKYFSSLNKEYYNKWLLVKGIVCGVDVLTPSQKDIVYSMIADCTNIEKELLLSPFKGVRFAGNIEPESGFFVMLDFSGLKNHYYKDIVIKTERDILLFYYLHAYTKLLMGSSIGWPHANEFVARVSFAMSNSEIIEMFMQMKRATNLLKE